MILEEEDFLVKVHGLSPRENESFENSSLNKFLLVRL